MNAQSAALFDAHLELPRAVVFKRFARIRGVGCDPDDLEAVGLVALWKAAQEFDGRGRFSGFAWRSIEYAILDRLRDGRVIRRKRDRTKPCPKQIPASVLASRGDMVPFDPPVPDETVEQRERAAVLHAAIERLPAYLRVTVHARLAGRLITGRYRRLNAALRVLSTDARLMQVAGGCR